MTVQVTIPLGCGQKYKSVNKSTKHIQTLSTD